MFFKHKNQDELYKRLEEKLSTIIENMTAKNHQIDHLSRSISKIDSLTQSIQQQNDVFEQKMGQLLTDVHKHDMAIEDLLDEWDEKKSDEADIRERFQELEQNERNLLELFEAYLEQFWNLRHYAVTKDETWAEQIALMEQNLEQYQRACNISLIQTSGAAVNYDLHDVIEAIDTCEQEKDKLIADVYRPGYLYRGKVKKKAQVAAYRMVRDDRA